MSLANLVRVSSLTVGTGTLTMGSAVTGFLTPTQAGMVDGVTYSYAIEADYVTVGDDLVPTSREVGTGIYTASGGTLTRNVVNSTNSNALLSLAGDAEVIITPLAEDILGVTLRTSDLDLYVDPSGSDSNDGSIGAPFATIQHAVNVGASFNFDNTYALAIHVNDGAVNDLVGVSLPNIVSSNPNSNIFLVNTKISGNVTTPANVTMDAYFAHENGSSWQIEGFKWTGSDAAHQVGVGAVPVFFSCEFGGNFSIAAIATYGGFTSGFVSDFTISSDMNYFIWSENGSQYALNDWDASTITFANSPDFAGAFILLTGGAFQFRSSEFINAATVTGVKGNLKNYAYLDLAAATADAVALTRTNFPGNFNFTFSQGESSISSDPCLFADLPSALSSPGLRQHISDAKTNVWNASLDSGGGQFAATIIAEAGAWKLIAAADAALLILNQIATGYNSGSPSAGTTVDAPQGTAVVVGLWCISGDPAHVNALVDSIGNTYTKAIETSGGGGSRFNCSLWYCLNVNHLPIGTTFTATTSAGQYAFIAAHLQGYNGGVDATAADGSGSGTSASLTWSGSNTSDIAMVFMIPSGATGTFNIGSGFFNLMTAAQSNAGNGCFGQKFENGTGDTWAPSWVSSTSFTAVAAAFSRS